MKEKLIELLKNSASFYFNYPVSAAVICKDGKIFYGVNVETSSPSAGICAERNALYNAITNGYTKGDFKEIHVMSKNGVFPCFICRQALTDFCDEDVMVYANDINGNTKMASVKDLCTYKFNSEDLI